MSKETYTIDFNKFKRETGLDDSSLKELYQGFLEELLEEKEKLLTQFQDKDYARLEKTVHNIKGISSSYMAENVFRQSQSLDLLLKHGKTAEVEVLVSNLTNDIIEAAGDIVSYYHL